jgi:sugar diacid utilization regulator
MMVKDLDQRFPLLDIRIALSQQLTEIGLISTAHETLTKGLQMIHQRHVKEKVLTSQSMRLIALFNKLSVTEMKDFVQSVIGPLLTYEKKHGGNLLETLDRLISNQFHLKKTADMMFIHYNTLRHRLRILEQLGYQKGVLDTNRYDFILAVYIATNVLDASERV